MEKIKKVKKKLAGKEVPWKIMIVDDQEETRELLKFAFENENFEVFVRRNGKEALEGLPAINPDIIIMDMVMPEMDGYSTLLQLRQLPELTRVPIIVSTTKEKMKPFIMENEKTRPEAFIEKPFSVKYIIARVYEILNKYQDR